MPRMAAWGGPYEIEIVEPPEMTETMKKAEALREYLVTLHNLKPGGYVVVQAVLKTDYDYMRRNAPTDVKVRADANGANTWNVTLTRVET